VNPVDRTRQVWPPAPAEGSDRASTRDDERGNLVQIRDCPAAVSQNETCKRRTGACPGKQQAVGGSNPR